MLLIKEKLYFNNLLLHTLLGFVCLIGDKLLNVSSDHSLIKAVCDNVTHAFIGLLSSLIIVTYFKDRLSSYNSLFLIFLCFIISSFIDLDHFISAKSYKLQVSILIITLTIQKKIKLKKHLF